MRKIFSILVLTCDNVTTYVEGVARHLTSTCCFSRVEIVWFRKHRRKSSHFRAKGKSGETFTFIGNSNDQEARARPWTARKVGVYSPVPKPRV
ncbi:hypothetical protein BJX66DRAFT_246704 [Aspergillus keveii]|uniref:Secreted protein n=1 Tax=Aspergillus keveii TaxID=714993 RepID=A0ABR4G0D5_9EURO